MVKKNIILLVSAAALILLTCIAVAMITNYIANREDPVTKSQIDASAVTQSAAPLIEHEMEKPTNDNPAIPEATAETAQPVPAMDEPAEPETGEPVSVMTQAGPDGQQAPSNESVRAMSGPPGSPVLELPPFMPTTNTTGPVPTEPAAAQDTTKPGPANDTAQNPPPPARPSVTGPVAADGAKHEDLPPFTPVTNTTGPVKNENQN